MCQSLKPFCTLRWRKKVSKTKNAFITDVRPEIHATASTFRGWRRKIIAPVKANQMVEGRLGYILLIMK